jgi:protein-S-isoprenylcysteine O-methyltransferase Ste14
VPKTASFLAFALMVVGLVGLFGNGALFARHPAVMAVQAAAVLLMVAARITFGVRSFHATANPTAGGVVSTGPYAYVRHPIYAAAIYLTWAGALDHASWINAGWATLVTAGGFIRMLLEERMLVERYPEYRDYMARVKRVVPFVF